MFDRDLDTPRRRAPRISWIPWGYQRLVVNPSLSALGWIAASALLHASLRSHNLALGMVSLVCFALPIALVQYHCLDCGATGWLREARGHACRRVFERQSDGQDWNWIPRPWLQLVLWAHLLLGGLILFELLRGDSLHRPD
jgi:hypothetical protein